MTKKATAKDVNAYIILYYIINCENIIKYFFFFNLVFHTKWERVPKLLNNKSGSDGYILLYSK